MICHCLFSQDLIVKQSLDSVNCKIYKIDNNYIRYSINTENGRKEFSIHTNDIINYSFGYYANAETVIKKDTSVNNPVIFGLYIGKSYRINFLQITNTYTPENYNYGLKEGLSVSGDVTFILNKYIGAGGKFSYFKTSNSVSNITGTFYDTTKNEYYDYTGKISDVINISYLGVYIMGKYDIENFSMYCNFGIGGNIYANKNTYLILDRKFTAESFGFSTDIGLDFKISKSFAIGTKFSYNYGLLKTIRRDGEYMDLRKSQYVDLQHYGIYIGLKYILK